MTAPKSPAKVLIIVSGGVVRNVVCSRKDIEVTLIDHDDLGCCEDLDAELVDAYQLKLIEEMGKKPLMDFFDRVTEEDVRGIEPD